MAPRKPGRARSYDRHLGRVAVIGVLSDGLIYSRIDAVGYESFQGSNGNALAPADGVIASGFALAVTNPRTNRRQGVNFPDELICVFVFALFNQSDITPDLGAEGAGGLAGRTHQIFADKSVTFFVNYVPFILVVEVTQGAQYGIGGGLSEAAHGGVFHHLRQFLQKVQALKSCFSF